MKTMKMLLAVAVVAGISVAAQAQAKPAPAAAAKPPARVRTQLQGFDLSANSGKSANQIGGASRDLGTPRLFAPAMAKAYSTTPTFYWGTADASEKVTFRLSSINGQTLYETTTTANHLTYPADAPALMAGTTYRWTIVPENDMLGGAPQPASIMIVSGAEREAIQSELGAANGAAAAHIFLQHRIWYDALSGYTMVLDGDPGNKEARTQRATLYDQLPATYDQADADWKMVH